MSKQLCVIFALALLFMGSVLEAGARVEGVESGFVAYGIGHSRAQDETLAEKESAAYKAAKEVAYKELAEYLFGITVSGETKLSLGTVKEQEYTIKLAESLRKLQYVQTMFDGHVENQDGDVVAWVAVSLPQERLIQQFPEIMRDVVPSSIPERAPGLAAFRAVLPVWGQFFDTNPRRDIVNHPQRLWFVDIPQVFVGGLCVWESLQYRDAQKRYDDADSVDEIREHFDDSVKHYRRRNWCLGGYVVLATMNAYWSYSDTRFYPIRWLELKQAEWDEEKSAGHSLGLHDGSLQYTYTQRF